MKKLGVTVKTGPYSTGSLTIGNGQQVTVRIPEYNHDNLIRIHKDVRRGWKVELTHPRPGFGKPYLLSLTNHEKDDKIKISIVPQPDFVKTSLMECTFKSLKHFTLTGPNITTNKSQYDKTTDGMILELVSRGTSRISSHPLQIRDLSVRVIPNEGCTDLSDIYVDTGAVLRCSTFEASIDGQGDVFINGTVTCGSFGKEKCLTVRIGTGDLHVNVDGALGQEVADATRTKNAILTKRLNVDIQNGNLTNFGSMIAQDYLVFKSNNLKLCSDSKHDTAQRGFNSFISLQKEMGNLDDIETRPKKTSSFNDLRIFKAVQNVDCDHFISIVNEEIDPAVKIHGRSIQDEFRAVCGGGKYKHVYDKDQHKKEIIRSGLATCEWKHGVIRAASIECLVRQDIDDCSQLQGNYLHFDVGGSVSVVKPWTWISGTVSGLIRGDLLLHDNAMLRGFQELQVLGNVLISKTSTLWVKEGGQLHCGKVCENQNVIISEGNFVLNVGELKQDGEGGIISNGDLLLTLRDGQENSWFGYVHADKHLFIQLKEKVSCDAICIASACDVEFFGRSAQLVVNQILILEDGDLCLVSSGRSEIPNFVLFGELHAKGINGITASVFTMPGSIADLTCAWNAESELHTVDVITRTLQISADSVVTCSGPRDEENNNINDLPVSASVSSEEQMSVHGKLQAFATFLVIQANSLKNAGKIELSPGTKDKTLIPSTLRITCEKNTVNSGSIKSEGYLVVKSETLSNQKGLIESSIDTVLDLGELKQDKEGRIVSHRDLQITLQNEQDDGWYGYVHTDRYLFIQVEKKVACDAECMAKECSVKFHGSNAQLVVNHKLDVQEGRLILEAVSPNTSPNFVVKGRLNATEINGITASVCTLLGAVVDLTCVCNGEEEAHKINILTRSLEINADSVMNCSCLQDKENADILPFPTSVFCTEFIAVHGKLQVFATNLHIQAKLLNNSGEIELSSCIQSKTSTLSSLCITCEKNTVNSGSIKSEGYLVVKSETLSNQKGLIESSIDTVLDLGELKQDKEGRIVSHRDLQITLQNEQDDGWYGYVHTDRYLFIQVEKKVACDAECMAKECSVKFHGSNAQLVVNHKLDVQEGRLILEAVSPNTSPNFVVKGRLNATEINGITASVCTLLGAVVDLTCVCNGEEEAHKINILTRSLEINADSVMNCSCLQDKENADILPFPTSVFCTEFIAVHGKLQVFATNLHIQAKLLNNSGEIELSSCIQSKTSTLSSLCITCEKNTVNSGTITCEGSLKMRSETLSNKKGVIESSTDLVLNLGELKQEKEGRIVSHRDLYITCEKNTVNSGTITCDERLEIKSETLSNKKGVIESSNNLLLNLGKLNQEKEGRIVSHRDLYITCEKNTVNSGTITCEGGLKMRSQTLSNKKGVIESSTDLVLNLGELKQEKEGRIVSHRDLYITCEKNTVNSGTITCEGSLKMRSQTLSNENGVIKASHELRIDVFSTDETTLSGQVFVDRYLHVHSQSHKEFSFSAVGGKCEISETFVLPDKFQVTCEKGDLSMGSAIVSSRDIEAECLFILSRRLKWHKESHLGNVFVQFSRSEDPNSPSKFIVEDSFHANLLFAFVNESVTTKETLVFEGPSKLIAIKVLKIDKSIGEVTFDTELECVNLEANSIHVPGRMRCVQSAGEEKPSTIIVDDTFTLSGGLECVGCVEVNVERSFVQENTEASSIDVLHTLRIITGESGLVSLEGLTTGKNNSLLEIEAKDIQVSGTITNVSDLKLTAENDLHLSEEGRIFSCNAVEIKGEWITMAGSIKEFLALQIEPWALLNSGKIESDLKDSNVCLSSYLALVNSGSCKGQVTSLEAPFLLSLPGKEIADVNDVTNCQLVGRDRILLESITCFLGGSTLQSNKVVENNTVLLFKFLAYVSCTPDAKSLEAWSKAAESLKHIQSEYADKGRKTSNSLKDLKKGCTSAEIGLRIDQMYSMVNVFVADILKNGIESFDVPRLVFIITSESQRYTTINIWKEKLLAIPHKARQLRQWMKKKGIKGLQSIMKRFGFSESKRKSNRTEGILESGAFCFSEGVTFTDSGYEALFDEVFSDEGVLSALDVVVASKEIAMTKREKKAIAMMMFADEVCQAGDITSDSFVMKSEGKAELVGKIDSDKAAIQGKSGVNLAYQDKSTGRKTADHRFKELALKTDKINQVNDLLEGEGVYKDLKIADQLDLAVTDQDIVLSRCNIEQRYKFNLEAKSVNIDNARVDCEKGVSITSHKSMNVSDSSISSRGSTILHSTKGNVCIDSSNVEAENIAAVKSDEGSIYMTAGSFSGDQGALLKAKDDITIDPIESHHSSSSSDDGFFSSSQDSSSYSTVSKARISSKCGDVAIVSEEGSVNATATEINAAGNIAISGKKDVVIQDKVTIREEVHEKSNWFRTKRTVKRTEEHHCSTLKAGGSLSISSQESNVSMIGTNSQVGGDMMLHAAGTVLLEDRILSSSEQSHSSGLSFSLDKGLSIGNESKQQDQQRLAGCRTDVGGNFVVSAQNFDVKNAMTLDVGNMIIDAKNVSFEGAELHNTSSMDKCSLDIWMNQLGISGEESRAREKKVVNQNVTVRGRTHFTNAENVNLTACNLDTGALSGNIDKLNVISKQSEIEAFKQSTSIGFTIVDGLPVPNKFGRNQSSDVGKFVEHSSGIHCRGPINQDEFQVGSLKLKGSSVTADGDIGNFAVNIITEKVKSYRSQSSSGFSIGVEKKGIELGINASNKFMSMEHEGTIASSSGTVSEIIEKSVNTDFSKHCRITAQHSSALGINIKAAKDGVGAGLQVNDTAAGFCASKDNVGMNVQHGDKGLSLSGGKSGFSGSLQDGENSLGLGLSKKNVNLSVKTNDSAIGTSLGKGGVSASLEHKNLSIGGSLSKGSKSLQVGAGDFQAGLARDKNRATGSKSTSASLSVADVGISGSTSKGTKAIDVYAKDFKTGIRSEKNSATGKKTRSANMRVKDLEIGGSTSKHSKSFQFKKGDFQTGIKREKEKQTGKKTTSARLRVKDLEVGGSTSENSKSFDLKTPDFQTGFRQDKDATTGSKTTSGRVKVKDLEVGGSTSENSKSFDLKTPDFQTGFRQDKDATTGSKTTSGRVKVKDLEVGGSTSENSKSFDLKTPDFQTGFRQDKDATTGSKTTSGRVKVKDLEVGGSTSENSKSFDLKTPDFQTGFRQDKDATTGSKTTSGRVKVKDLEVGGSTSENSKSFDLKTPDFQTGFRQDKDATTGSKTTSGRVKVKDLEVGGSTSENSKSFDLKTPDFQTGFRQDKDATTGSKTTSGRVKVKDLEVGGSTSENSKSFDLKTPDFQTGFRQDKDATTGSKTTSGRVKVKDLEVGGSTSENSKSFDLKTPDFQTGFRQDKHATTGSKTTSGRVKVKDLEVGGSTSENSKSIDLKTPDFQTGFRQDKDATTGSKTTSGRVKVKDLEVGGSTSENSKSFDLKTPDFQTGFRQDKDATTGSKTTSGRVKVKDLEVGGSTSENSKSFDLKTPDFQTGFRQDKDATTGSKTTSGRVKVKDLEVGGSTSENSKSFDLKTPDFQTAFRQDKDATTGSKTTSGRVKVKDLEVGGSTSENSKSIDLKTPDFQTGFRQDKDATTGSKTTSGRVKVKDLEVGGSTSENSKSFDLKTPDFQTGFRQDKDATTGSKTTSGRVKVKDLEVGGSTSENSKSIDLKTPHFQTGFRQDKDATTGSKTTSGRVKVKDLEVGGSTSENSKEF